MVQPLTTAAGTKEDYLFIPQGCEHVEKYVFLIKFNIAAKFKMAAKKFSLQIKALTILDVITCYLLGVSYET